MNLSPDGNLSGTPSAIGTNSFTVTATDTNGCAGSQAYTLAILGAPPSITTQPRSQNVLLGADAAFSVVASGTTPLTYQWQFNGTNLTDNARVTGSQSSTLTVSNLLYADAGNYAVMVASPVGSTLSQPGTLNVLGPTNIGRYAFTNFVGQPGGSAIATARAARRGFTIPAAWRWTARATCMWRTTDNYTIRKVTPAGVVTTLAGSAGSSGSADGTGSAARFYYPIGVAVDSAGNVYVADYWQLHDPEGDPGRGGDDAGGQRGASWQRRRHGQRGAVLLSFRRGGGQRGQRVRGGLPTTTRSGR